MSDFLVFFLEKSIELYSDLLKKIKAAVPYIRDVPDTKIGVGYKDTSLGVFILITPGDNLVLDEAFINAYDCGAETFRRVELEIRETDSPFIAKSRRCQFTNISDANLSEENKFCVTTPFKNINNHGVNKPKNVEF